MAEFGKTGAEGFTAEVAVEDGGTSTLVRVAGEIDLATADRFRHAVLDGLAQDTEVVVVDLGDLTLLTSSGLSVLAESHEKARAEQRKVVVRTVGAPRIVVQAIKAVGLDQVLTLDEEPGE